MTIKISKKIKSYSVDDRTKPAATPGSPGASETPAIASAEVIQMHEKVERPDVLVGATYKIKSPLFEHALYVTINDIVLNQGTEYELRRPFEIFINSKNMDHFQWIVALTRIMSAVFRKGGDVTFLVEELKAVFDPRGGYFKAGGVYMNSIVAELGAVVEAHLKMIGMMHDPDMPAEQKKMIAEKRTAYESRVKKNAKSRTVDSQEAHSNPAGIDENQNAINAASVTAESFPTSASFCTKCQAKAVILMDGCATCLNCGYSKCG